MGAGRSGSSALEGPGGLGGGCGGGADEAPSMLSVLCHQRDRFRARLREVEEAMGGLQQELAKVGRGKGVAVVGGCWGRGWVGRACRAGVERQRWAVHAGTGADRQGWEGVAGARVMVKG